MKKLILLLTLLPAVSALAVTVNVPGDYTTIQEGIDAAANGDTVLVADGVYTGPGNVEIDFSGKNIVVMSDNGPNDCIIECAFLGRGFQFQSGESSSAQLIGFMISNGFASPGAGIAIVNSSPVIKQCIIANCMSGSSGGGVYINGGEPQFINSVIHNCTASEGGGLSSQNADVTINSCVIAANTSTG